MDNMNCVEIITQAKQYEIHSPVGPEPAEHIKRNYAPSFKETP